MIIDTSGLNESDNEDTEHIRGMVEFLRRRGWVHNFLIVPNGHHPRMNHSFKGLTWWEKFPHHPGFLLLQRELPGELVSTSLTAVKTELDENEELKQQFGTNCVGAYYCGNHNGVAKRVW